MELGVLLMVHEERRIFFDYSETYKALYALCVQKEMKKPPAGAITGIRTDPKDDKNLIFVIENNLDNTAGEREYSRDFLAAALMLYCRGLRIPLPKGARKFVDIGPERVVLNVII